MSGPSDPWYHGSPLELAILRAGSTITQVEVLARVFSHKPSIVSMEEHTAGQLKLRHNGTLPGLLYVIDEPVSAANIEPHPRSSMPAGLEWLTRRPLRLRLVGRVEIEPGEMLTEEEINRLVKG